MHYLVTVLVHLGDVGVTVDSIKDKKLREYAIEDIRYYASENTAQYYNTIFDWRETDTAGRWYGDYPENVICGCENPDKVREELERTLNTFNETRRYALTRLRKEYGTTDLEKLFDKYTADKYNSLAIYYIEQACGAYSYNSTFYNAANGTAIITEDIIKVVMEHIDNYAVVLFDEHR